MTIKELIEQLKELPSDYRVYSRGGEVLDYVDEQVRCMTSSAVNETETDHNEKEIILQ